MRVHPVLNAIILLVFIPWTCARGPAANQMVDDQKSMELVANHNVMVEQQESTISLVKKLLDNVLNKFIDRALQTEVEAFHHVNLDETTLAKASRLAAPTSNLSPLSFSGAHHHGFPLSCVRLPFQLGGRTRSIPNVVLREQPIQTIAQKSSITGYRRTGSVAEALCNSRVLDRWVVAAEADGDEGPVFKVGDTVRVKEPTKFFHVPGTGIEGFEAKGSEGTVVKIFGDEDPPLSINRPIKVQFLVTKDGVDKKWFGHFEDFELEHISSSAELS